MRTRSSIRGSYNRRGDRMVADGSGLGEVKGSVGGRAPWLSARRFAEAIERAGEAHR